VLQVSDRTISDRRRRDSPSTRSTGCGRIDDAIRIDRVFAHHGRGELRRVARQGAANWGAAARRRAAGSDRLTRAAHSCLVLAGVLVGGALRSVANAPLRSDVPHLIDAQTILVSRHLQFSP
jgi:hypothetical protein